MALTAGDAASKWMDAAGGGVGAGGGRTEGGRLFQVFGRRWLCRCDTKQTHRLLRPPVASDYSDRLPWQRMPLRLPSASRLKMKTDKRNTGRKERKADGIQKKPNQTKREEERPTSFPIGAAAAAAAAAADRFITVKWCPASPR